MFKYCISLWYSKHDGTSLEEEHVYIEAATPMQALLSTIIYFDRSDGRESIRRQITKVEVRWLHTDIP